MAHKQIAQQTLLKLCEDLEEVAIVERRPSMEGRMMQVIMAPNLEALKVAEKAKASTGAKKQKRAEKGKKGKKGGLPAGVADELGLSDDDEEEEEDGEDDVDLEALNASIDASDEDEDGDSEEAADGEGSPYYDLDSLTVEELGGKIEEVGGRVRALKEGGSEKEEWVGLVDELLSLKARYQELAGSPWVPKTPA